MQGFSPAEIGLPHLSYSSVCDFLRDRREFKKRWIDHDWSRDPELPLLEGSAFHAAVEVYWGARRDGIDKDTWIPAAVAAARSSIERDYTDGSKRIEKFIAAREAGAYEQLGCQIDQRTSGNRTLYYALLSVDAIVAGVMESVLSYAEQTADDTRQIISLEIAHTTLTKDAETGEDHIFPLKAKIDQIAARIDPTGVINFRDYKYVSSDLDEDENGNPLITPAMILQASSYMSIAPSILMALGLDISRLSSVFIFEVFNKRTQRLSIVEVPIGRKETIIWSRIFAGVQQDIVEAYSRRDPNLVFIPNPFGAYGKSVGWDEFAKDVELSIQDETYGAGDVEAVVL